MSNLPAVALFAYKRPQHLRRTIESLARNHSAAKFDLVLYSDAPKTAADRSAVEQVRKLARSASGFGSVRIVEREHNLGLANSIISGVSELLRDYPSAIVLEDDMLASPGFLEFMRDGLDEYRSDQLVSSVCAYSPYPQNEAARLTDTYFLPGADCWGWGTWPRAWAEFRQDAQSLADELRAKGLIDQFDYFGAQNNYKMLLDFLAGKNDSWAIRWHASCFLKGMCYLCPRFSLIENIGVDGSGTHCSKNSEWNPGPLAQQITVERREIKVDPLALENARLFFSKVNQRSSHKGVLGSLLGKVFRS